MVGLVRIGVEQEVDAKINENSIDVVKSRAISASASCGRPVEKYQYRMRQLKGSHAGADAATAATPGPTASGTLAARRTKCTPSIVSASAWAPRDWRLPGKSQAGMI